MTIRKPTRTSLASQIVGEMERLIRHGEWAQSSRIPSEPELMKLFGVSRNTVREAVQSLIHAGLLSARPGDGTYVRGRTRLEILIHNELSGSELAPILEARMALETGIAALAARNRTEADLERLSRLLELRNNSGDQKLDADFHMAVAGATHNPLLADFYNEICLYMLKNLADRPLEGPTLAEEIELHNRLFAAVRQSDEEAARIVTGRIIAIYSDRMTSKK